MDKEKKVKWGISIVIVALVGVFMLVLNLSDIKVNAAENKIQITAILFDESILMDDITSITLVDDFHYGNRDFGTGAIGINIGDFKHPDLGKYKCASFTSVKKNIIIKSNNKIIVFNQKSNEKTIELYNILVGEWKS